jgi:branched-subunit amino acid transport protein
MNIWPTIFVVGVFTFAIRLSFILLFGRIEIPPELRRALRYVPPAVLTAIIFPELLLPSGALYLSPGNERLLAGIIAGFVAWRTGNVVITLVSGMGALLLLQAIGS